MKKVYGQSAALTWLKFSGISIVYITLLALAATGTIVWGVIKI
jgi:hypothetical protein